MGQQDDLKMQLEVQRASKKPRGNRSGLLQGGHQAEAAVAAHRGHDAMRWAHSVAGRRSLFYFLSEFSEQL